MHVVQEERGGFWVRCPGVFSWTEEEKEPQYCQLRIAVCLRSVLGSGAWLGGTPV
jgi:hypothetical protein